ncbi:phosphoribosyltransferase family protein [Actinokineospora sp. NBRC 105648]|uniref:phosphoribosyltransferase n=1 Tax=Actinokineospora sp. NBRC 105648 TaxID=3032206 RepID=UPI0024A0353B|nr:hypothetical protein Acsp05_40880 [Actinokineospora sp. NBRC 105648]
MFDQRALRALGLVADDLAEEVLRERAEVRRRIGRYRGDRPPPQVAGRTVVVVDDGLATGATARAALRWVRPRGPARLLLAVPVAPPETCAALSAEADTVVCAHAPADFTAVGAWYDDFGQLADTDVDRYLGGR